MDGRKRAAWVDESIHLDAKPHGIYVLAATITSTNNDLEILRSTLRSLVVKPRRRLHWRDEDNATRSKIISAIVKMDLHHVVIVRNAVDPKRQERARRKCLERLLFELDCRQVKIVWLEHRSESLNKRDLDFIDTMRITGMITDQLRVTFSKPHDEPLLWLPDAVAGVVASSRKTSSLQHQNLLIHTLTKIDI